MSQEPYAMIPTHQHRNHLNDSLDNNDTSVDEDRHSTSTLTTTLYSYQQDHPDMDVIIDNLESNMNTTVLDVEIGISSVAPPTSSSTNGTIEQVFSSGVLLYLSAKELSKLSMTSRYFNVSCNKTYLWKRLLKTDFLSYHDGSNDRDDTSSYHSIITMASTYPTPSKLLYIRRYKEAKRSIEMRKSDHISWIKIIRTNKWKNFISKFLDLTQFRILIPLPSLCLFISILLLSLRLDHKISISVWSCGLPLFILIIYIVFCFLVTLTLYLKRYNSNSLFQNHFYQLRSPFIVLFNDDFHGYKRVIWLFITVLSLVAIQVALIFSKLDAVYGGYTTDRRLKHTSWGIVFIPIWLMFTLYAGLPMMKVLRDLNGYLIGLLVGWIPFFIFLVSLASKLSNDPDRKIRMSLILMPFWLLEGSVLVSSLAFLSLAIKNYRLGATENFYETIGVVVSAWLALSPFLIFQILLSVKDDNTDKVFHIDAATPILIVLGLLFIASALSVSFMKTPFEV